MSKFTWPPREGGDQGPEHRDPALSRRARWREAIREIERTWLGVTAPPLDQRMEEVGWSPEVASDACPRCAIKVGPHEVDGGSCPRCATKRLAWDGAPRLGPHEGLLRDVIHEIKFTAWHRLGEEAGRLLGARVRERLELESVQARETLVVPVATSTRRRLARGIDHPLAIARGVSRATGVDLLRALGRRHVASQLEVARSERDRNVRGSFRMRRGVRPEIRLIVLVDDVRTTGATLTAACRTLRDGVDAGRTMESDSVRIWAATLSVAEADVAV